MRIEPNFHCHLVLTTKQPMCKKATIHQVTTMLGHKHRWLAGGYDLETEHF